MLFLLNPNSYQCGYIAWWNNKGGYVFFEVEPRQQIYGFQMAMVANYHLQMFVEQRQS
jgi:hypothetical protein